MKVYYNREENKVPIKSWCPEIEEGALEQAKNLSKLPFVFKHIALMPDCHQGYGMPIGGVIATKDVIIPNAVGVDIGCGVGLIETPFTINDIDLPTLKEIMGKIRKTIPLGFNHHKEAQSEEFMPINKEYSKLIESEMNSARKQIGTLGGGNHFIEIQKDEEGKVYVMLHSGSRNLGKKVCDYYNKLAIELNKKWASSIPDSYELNFLPISSDEGKNYIKDMNYCLDFAKCNRNHMMLKIIEIIRDVFKEKGTEINKDYFNIFDIHHNYAILENHFGEEVWVHRKGATLAEVGTKGLIPGSQGTASYVVEGLGNSESFNSCSHGAGRKMGRKEAERTLNLEEEKKRLEDKGILHAIRGKSDLEEAAGAYKDIDMVMENQKDLVKIVKKLEPMGVIKG